MTSRIWCLLAIAFASAACKCPKQNHFVGINRMVWCVGFLITFEV
nr:MAG TPA: hypothetical protein [Caudoviricetes sp.]